MTAAAWWYRHQTRRLLRHLRDPRWELVLAVSPDVEGLQSRIWPPDLARVPQGRGDLGERMRTVLAKTPGPSILVGSDIPGIRSAHIAEAFSKLGGAASVIGPGSDGGFWLIGLQRPMRQSAKFFRGIRWSHAETLADTLPTLPKPVAFSSVLSDVDSAADLERKCT